MALLSPIKSAIYAHGSEIYEISDQYDASVSGFTGDVEYYGFLNLVGGWIIQAHTISTGTYRYVQGSSDYTTNWTAKGALVYGYYNTLFVTNP